MGNRDRLPAECGMNGEFGRFSEGKLLTFLKQLDTEIVLHLRCRSVENREVPKSTNLEHEIKVTL